MRDYPKFITLPFKLERPSPPFGDSSIRSPENVMRFFIKEFTKKGDKAFDPFAGLGTTLFVAEELGRIPYGIEADPKRFEWTAGQLTHWQNMILGDSASIPNCKLPKMDFCITSPPFMARNQKANPLFAGKPKYAGYTKYLAQLGYIFSQTASIMKKGAHLVVHVENIYGRTYTPLVSDMQQVISTSFEPVGETIVQ